VTQQVRKVSLPLRSPSSKQPWPKPMALAATTRDTAIKDVKMEATTDKSREATTIEGKETADGITETDIKSKVAIMIGMEEAVTIGEPKNATVAEMATEAEMAATKAIGMEVAEVISTSHERKSSTNQLSIPTRTTASSTAMTPNSSPRLLARKKAPMSSRSTSSQATRSSKRLEARMMATLKWT